ncbi:SLAP domain-containing protein [Companilactobacillus metriopterae]|uniref:SLAP domain-containing protein n=1 Tax=Companilactobacillus metriopterae TaxID=1909267 RepID=UPI00100A58F5|nr:SLAP domain-containing protein [Companilactobacillus metriopterae]
MKKYTKFITAFAAATILSLGTVNYVVLADEAVDIDPGFAIDPVDPIIDPDFSVDPVVNPDVEGVTPTVDENWVNTHLDTVVTVKDGLSAPVFDYDGNAIGDVAPQNTPWYTDQQHTSQKDGKVYYRIATNQYILADQVN